jgi:hypothetical protein
MTIRPMFPSDLDARCPENLIRELFALYGMSFREWREGGRPVFAFVERDEESGIAWTKRFHSRAERGEHAMARLFDAAPASAMRGEQAA